MKLGDGMIYLPQIPEGETLILIHFSSLCSDASLNLILIPLPTTSSPVTCFKCGLIYKLWSIFHIKLGTPLFPDYYILWFKAL